MAYSYDEPAYINKECYLATLDRANPTEICTATVNAVHHISDYDWLVEQFTSLLAHTESDVRGVAITCVGHLARLHEGADREELLALLTSLKDDEALSGRVQDAIDDVNTFLEK